MIVFGIYDMMTMACVVVCGLALKWGIGMRMAMMMEWNAWHC